MTTSFLSMPEIDSHYVAGRWVRSGNSEYLEVINPSLETTLARVCSADLGLLDRAVDAAAAALALWRGTPVAERAAAVRRIIKCLEERAGLLAETVTAEIGAPINFSRDGHVALPILVGSAFLDIVKTHPFSESAANAHIIKEPVGVVGCITPWNFPLHQIAVKVFPALLAGCALVLKPSELSPLSALEFMRCVEAAGLPDGVVNLVLGTGAELGRALSLHPKVDKVTFTGSTAVGRRIAAQASGRIKRITLELGGKSPAVVLEDGDLGKAVAMTVRECMINSGQTCTALSRLIVPAARMAEASEMVRDLAGRYVLGDPMDPNVNMGPLVSSHRRESVRALISSGISQGARLLVGGIDPPQRLDRGFFVKPTAFADVTRQMRLAQEEVFGPVLCLMAYEREDEAIEIANDSQYGLMASVWSRDQSRALRAAHDIHAGHILINDAPRNPIAPFGGFKESGIGRELGSYGLEEFLEIKSILTKPLN